ncbi:hypothetical protein EDF36_0695 [Rathayibacter sp. PhB152]|uniref:hypothetical protein n=1 Tax=Rathayibacter sp. PhB152 TaxID=2485190 RepID=UPI000F4C57BE|nr:hypothetical protein [Rathayibacter sp. PhB152]ROQ65192.1 hypothetical protein EDF36_0695 [Rathayibacter sp. PhB152]
MPVPSRSLLRTAVAGTALALGVGTILSGCVSSDEPVAQPAATVTATATATVTATPAPTSTPAPTATPAAAASLLIGPTSFSLVDATGAQLGSWAYRDGTGAVAALTEAFGSEPTESDDVPYEGYRSRAYIWPGFVLRDTDVYDAGGPELTYPEPDFLLEATAATVGDVAISTLGGVTVGDATAELAAEHPESTTDGAPGSFLFDTTPVGTLEGYELTNTVGAIAEDEVTVSSLRAPFVNWGV